MNSFTLVVTIVAIFFTAQTIQQYLKMKSAEKAAKDPEIEDTLLHIERLEERIKVLERIVTENKYDLNKEIDSLK